MAFDEIQFPLKAGYSSSGGPSFLTEVITINGGYERRNQVWGQARRKFDARTGVHSNVDAIILGAFFQARAGRARGFRLRDWSDCTSASDGISAPAFGDQGIGTGDGSTVSFQLVKNYSSSSVTHQREIRKPVEGTVVIGVAGVQSSSGWSVDTTTGIVTFVTAPAGGAVITAGYQFDIPVRFDTDQLKVVTEDKSLVRTEIPIIEIRT